MKKFISGLTAAMLAGLPALASAAEAATAATSSPKTSAVTPNAQMMAMQDQQTLRGDGSEPKKKRHLGLLEIPVEPPPSLGVRLLNDVGWIDPPSEAPVDPQLNHAL